MNFSNIEGRSIDTLIEDFIELGNGDICTVDFYEENEDLLREMGLIVERSREWMDIDLMSLDMEE